MLDLAKILGIALVLVIVIFAVSYRYQYRYEPKFNHKQALIAASVVFADNWPFLLVVIGLAAVLINGLLGGL